MVYPVQIQIDPVAGCNHDCPFCIYRYDKDDDLNALFDERDIIPYAKMVEIFDDCVAMGTKAAELTGGGEPSAHPHFAAMLSDLHDRELEIGLVTNGAGRAWKRESAVVIDRMKQATWARFSIDAATAETHRITHRSSRNDFDPAIENMTNLCRAIKDCDSPTVVGMTFVVLPENAHEIVQAAELAAAAGVSYLRYTPMIFGENSANAKQAAINPFYDPDLMSVIRDNIDAAFKHNFPVRLVNMFDDRVAIEQSFGTYEQDDLCHYSHFQAVIGADSRLYPCCIWKYRPFGNIGSMVSQSFKDLWESEERRTYYENLDIHTGCGTCFLKPKNDAIKYVLDPNPPHINFI